MSYESFIKNVIIQRAEEKRKNQHIYQVGARQNQGFEMEFKSAIL